MFIRYNFLHRLHVPDFFIIYIMQKKKEKKKEKKKPLFFGPCQIHVTESSCFFFLTAVTKEKCFQSTES